MDVSSVAQQQREPNGVIAVGGSAGGVEALKQLVAGLPVNLPYAVLVVLHMSPGTPSVLGQILDRSGPCPAETASDGEPVRAGRIYVAVPDRHLLVHDGRIVVSRGPSEDGHRPAINSLMRATAVEYGPRAIGMLLSGVLDDGVLGLAAIRSHGGVAVVQHPDDALFPAMPLNALAKVAVDHQISAASAGALFMDLATRRSLEDAMNPDPATELENRIAMGSRFSDAFDSEAFGPPSGYTCPDCNGSLQLVGAGNYRCRVGHAWTPEALLRARDVEAENALWVALRSLQEKSQLARAHAEGVGPGVLQARYAQIADETEHAVRVLSERLDEVYRRIAESTDEAS
jgi:two-component system, chemotaxis family, protein-glutamate methylesterase/glutaminase